MFGRRMAVGALVLLGISCVSASGGSAVATETAPVPGTVASFGDASLQEAHDLAVGSDGNVWFTNRSGNSIGRMTPGGTYSVFRDPSISEPMGITAGPDGNLWFANSGSPSIGRITTSGDVTAFDHPAITDPVDIVAGSDGNLWYLNPSYSGSSIGRITTSGAVTSFDAAMNNPFRMKAGPDGRLWVLSSGRWGSFGSQASLVAFSTDGSSQTIAFSGYPAEFGFPRDFAFDGAGDVWLSQNGQVGKLDRSAEPLSLTFHGSSQLDGAGAMTTGPGGKVWFVGGDHQIATVNSTGTIEVHSDPDVGAATSLLTSGQTMWFINEAKCADDGLCEPESIGAISTDGSAVRYPDGATLARPEGIVEGPDGALWVASRASDSIVRLDPGTGGMQSFTSPDVDQPRRITAGPDGNLWFTSSANDRIGRLTPEGVISTFSSAEIDRPVGIAAGPDGNVWFASQGNDRVGKITPEGTITTYTAPSVSWPTYITAGSDGALWFTNEGSIGRVSVSGAISSFASPNYFMSDITLGGDGNVWVSAPDQYFPAVIRVTPDGETSIFSHGTNPQGVAAGPDGEIWITDRAYGGFAYRRDFRVGSFTNESDYSTVTSPLIGDALDIAPGSDGGMWFTNDRGNSIGRVQSGVRPSLVCGPTAPAGPFPDVDPTSPFCSNVEWFVGKGVTSGYPDGTYGPARPVLRQEMAAFLFRYANPGTTPTGCEGAPFDDVAAASPFCSYITWLVDQGITTGTGDGNFGSAGGVTRGAMAAFMFRLANPDTPAPSCEAAPFDDVAAGHPFCGYIDWLATTGVTTGYPDGTFRPGATVQRDVMAAFLNRLDDHLS